MFSCVKHDIQLSVVGSVLGITYLEYNAISSVVDPERVLSNDWFEEDVYSLRQITGSDNE